MQSSSDGKQQIVKEEPAKEVYKSESSGDEDADDTFFDAVQEI